MEAEAEELGVESVDLETRIDTQKYKTHKKLVKIRQIFAKTFRLMDLENMSFELYGLVVLPDEDENDDIRGNCKD